MDRRRTAAALGRGLARQHQVRGPAYGLDHDRPLYQLYYLLVHLNLFGEGYGPPVHAVLRRYAGQ